jgi:hypothetical protein
MLQPENIPLKYDNLFAGIDSGTIKIPKFQRDFVWDKPQTAKLIDSIIKGFPVGTFILWKTDEVLRHYKDIGNAQLGAPPKGDKVQYILDGQQRITSLYAVKKGLIITKDGKEIHYRDIYIDLSSDPDADESLVLIEKPEHNGFISVCDLLNATITDLARRYSDYLEKIDVYKKRLTTYDFSTIVISNYPMDIACEIFTRINTGGTELTLFEIMVAKTYDEKLNFDFAREYEFLIDNNGKEKDLEDAGYETIADITVLQCVAAHLCKQVRRKDILKLTKNKFIKNWPTVKDGIFIAVDYLRNHLRVPVSQLLPYNALLVPLTYFFNRLKGRNPTHIQNKLLTQYFWWASLTNRFTSGADGKIAADLKRMDKILKEEQPSYSGEEYEPILGDILWHWFSAGESFCKAIICLYASFEPKSFNSDSLITLDNSWLKQANSKNFHHFFPKSYLKKQGWDESQANSILNITLVDADLNKRQIRANAPNVYMKQFEKSNNNIDETMKTHLIDNLEGFGVWKDDYELFINKRGEKVLKEIKKRLQPNI